MRNLKLNSDRCIICTIAGIHTKGEKRKIEMCEALKQLREDGRIQATIETMQEVGISKDEIVSKIAEKFNLLPEETQKCVKSYWK